METHRYGSFPPVTWPEALVWIFAMICTAGLFAVLNSLIVISVLTGNTGRQRYKDMMDKVVDMLKNKNVPPELGRRVLRYGCGV